MNKIILGGILVTVMGGTPAATYFLTGERKEERNTSSNTNEDVSASLETNAASTPGGPKLQS